MQLEFEAKYLFKAYERKEDTIKTTLLQLIQKKGAKEENFVRLMVVYLMGTILFPNTSYLVSS